MRLRRSAVGAADFLAPWRLGRSGRWLLDTMPVEHGAGADRWLACARRGRSAPGIRKRVSRAAHGQLTCDATEETPTGYDLTLWCSCGETFAIRVTPEIAADDFIAQAGRN